MGIASTIPTTMSAASKRNIDVIADYGQRLFRFIRGRVQSREDAEDILQDVWTQFTAVIDSQPIEQASAWLFTVARNKITDKHRKIQPASLDEVSYETGEGEVFLKDLLLSPTGNPEHEHLRNAFWEQLFEALGELPEPQRQVFIWHELEDLSFEEIAGRTGDKINTLISRKRYAVLHLRERLQIIYNEIIHQ
jgi:RNA polymerase sigma factor (sigma-70 family)